MLHLLQIAFISCLLNNSAHESIVLTKEELLGKFDPPKHESFSLIECTLTSKTGIYLRTEVYEQVKKMAEAAKKEGVVLSVLSATRNYDYQKGIWERKWNGAKYKGWKDADIASDILKYSSMPGTSRHHWGTDLDFNSVEPSYFKTGNGKKVYDWLQKNAASFGFYQTYTSKENGRTGYNEEAWHWSYLPLAKDFLTQYNQLISYTDFSGFKGSATAKELNVIEVYVNGIEKALK
jgi:D-alanyl-D-alanine carboxypeptidase